MKARILALIGGAGLVAGVAALWPRKPPPAAFEYAENPDPNEPGESAAPAAPVDLVQAAPRADRNIAAFLSMIRVAEGTAGPNGYRALFGHTERNPKVFNDYSDHPRQAFAFTDKAGRRLWTSAAGAYQFMARSPIPGGGSTRVDTWGEVKARLDLPDFSPASQDAAALELIRQAGALGDVQAGRLVAAVNKVRGRWASLPGAGYDQPEKTMDTITAAYRGAGGTTA